MVVGNSTVAPKRPAKSNRADSCYLHIFTPQIYQVTVVDTARAKNTVACLGSSSSKTFISIMVIKEMAFKVRHNSGKNGMKTFFFVDSVSSATQYSTAIELHTDLVSTVCMTESEKDWHNALDGHHVILTSAFAFLAAVQSQYVSVCNVNLLVFDDCHLVATPDHAYSQIVDILYNQSDSNCRDTGPLILGLTSSILEHIATPSDLNFRLRYLEETMRSQIEMTSDAVMADPYSSRPAESTVECDEYVDKTGLIAKLSEILKSALDFVNDIQVSMDDSCEVLNDDVKTMARLVLTETDRVLAELGPWCAARVAAAFVHQLAKIDRPSEDLRHILLCLASTTLRTIEKTVDTLFDIRVQTLEDFGLFVSPKAIKLIGVIRDCKPDDNFVIMSGDFDGDLPSDDDCAESVDSMEDEPDEDTADGCDKRRSSQNCIQKISNGVTDKQPSSSGGQHYIAVRRSTCNGTADGSEQTSENDSICGVIFVDHRHVAFALNKLIVELCNWDPDLYFVRSHYIAGYIPSGASMSEAQRLKQETVLRKFRQREYNVLVATTALEEGVDLPRCNLVVRFNHPTSYRSYMLSKGRARGYNAKYCVLVYENFAQQFNADLDLYRGIEKILLDRCRNKDDYSADRVDESLVVSLMPPYHVGKDDGAFKVTMLSAIRIINRYCAKLPSDAFTHLTPRCCIEEVIDEDSTQKKYRAILRLPINSLIKRPIVGDAMPGKRLAQMAVALKACSELHEAKELDDHLQPVGRELIRYEDEDCEWEDHELHGQARPGSTKRKQFYHKKTARAFIESPRADVPCYLYWFRMTLTCPISEEQNTRGRPIHAPEDTSRGFGFLCVQQIPTVPDFPVFTRSGEVTISVQLASTSVCLTSDELARLHSFHHFVFCHVLRLEKSPMVFDPQHALWGCIVVPINSDDTLEKWSIDWAFVATIEESPLAASIRRGFKSNNRSRSCSSSVVNAKLPKKELFVFNEHEFADAVVMPSYRNIDQPQYFYVAEIRHDLSPRSSFPSPELYDTFEHYYKSKYNLTLTLLNQPLLDVDHTSARLNLLTPRYVNQKGVALLTSSATTRRAKRESLQQKQILIPELCDVHPFPASLWRKAVCVPAMLYRTNCLLIAEELRARIAEEARIGLTYGSLPFRPLKFDYCEPATTTPCAGDASVVRNQLESNENGGETVINSVEIRHTSEGLQVDPVQSQEVDSSIALQCSHSDDCGTHHLVRKCGKCSGSATVDQVKNNGDAPQSGGCLNAFVNETCSAGALYCTNVCDVSCKKCASIRPIQPQTTRNSEREEENNQQTCSSSSVDESNKCKYRNGKKVDSPGGGDNYSRFSPFSLDADTTSDGGPSPCDIIQTLTMSNANDFFNLERLETIGDSFLKFAVTIYLYCTYTGIHEGKLSYLRSLQVSNYNLYRLGKRKNLPECMVAVKFEPSENWLPPGYTFRHTENTANQVTSSKSPTKCGSDSSKKSKAAHSGSSSVGDKNEVDDEQVKFNQELEELSRAEEEEMVEAGKESTDVVVIGSSYYQSSSPYCLKTQHSLPDKSIADCVEALIGCYLASCGRRSALLFMDWLGLRVLPPPSKDEARTLMTTGIPKDFGCLPIPISPLALSSVPNAVDVLTFQLDGFDEFEKQINYRFKDRSYLLQAFTHASYHYNNITDCYQRLEFLGDAILDYVITRHLFEDSTKHSPGVLTDLRSALVNNNMFACLAVRWNFHKYFKAISPQLFGVIEKFIEWQMEHDYQVILDEEMGGTGENDDEDMEIPKALGDIFESVAGAIYLDSGMSLDAVWAVYYRMMKPHIDAFLEKIPKSPVRELLEMEPETAKFEKPERTIDGKIRVTVNVVGKGTFSGVGRNYRIAKGAAAKRALKVVKMVASKPDFQQSTFRDFPLVIRQ